jgi:hypothetical protein
MASHTNIHMHTNVYAYAHDSNTHTHTRTRTHLGRERQTPLCERAGVGWSQGTASAQPESDRAGYRGAGLSKAGEPLNHSGLLLQRC